MLGAALTLALIPAIASADGPGHFRGVVLAQTKAGRALGARLHGARRLAVSNLAYNGGPVMHSDANYTIYWEPSGYGTSSSYKATVDAYFGNVAAASGAATVDYSVATQYSDSSGPIACNASFGALTAPARSARAMSTARTTAR